MAEWMNRKKIIYPVIIVYLTIFLFALATDANGACFIIIKSTIKLEALITNVPIYVDINSDE